VQVRMIGLRLGGGARVTYLNSPATSSTGATAPKTETSYFFTVSGGGQL
jgi:hypothetical protein